MKKSTIIPKRELENAIAAIIKVLSVDNIKPQIKDNSYVNLLFR